MYVATLTVAGGTTLSIPVQSSNTAIGTISTSPVTMAGGASSAMTTFQPASSGTATISLTQPAGFVTPAQYSTVTATVTTASIAITDQETIGRNLQIQGSFSLGQAAPSGGLNLTLTSNDPNLLLSTSPTAAGSMSIVITIAAGGFNGQYYLQALGSSGTATYSGSAPGYVSRTATITFASSGAVLGDQFGTIGGTTFGSSPLPIYVYMAQLDSTGNYVQIQQLSGGAAPVTVPLTALNGTINPSVAVQPGSTNAIAQLTAASGSTVTVTAGTPAGYTPSNQSSISAFVF
jgi:hypothetical protein